LTQRRCASVCVSLRVFVRSSPPTIIAAGGASLLRRTRPLGLHRLVKDLGLVVNSVSCDNCHSEQNCS